MEPALVQAYLEVGLLFSNFDLSTYSNILHHMFKENANTLPTMGPTLGWVPNFLALTLYLVAWAWMVLNGRMGLDGPESLYR